MFRFKAAAFANWHPVDKGLNQRQKGKEMGATHLLDTEV